MFTLSIIILIGLFLIATMFFIECKIVDDLPENNVFKKWWRANIMAPEPKD